MILRPNSGVARISAIWMIVVIVLFLAAVGFAFVASSDRASERKAKEDARVEEQKATTTADVEANKRRDVTTVLGWYDRESADPDCDLAAARDGLERFREAFSDLGDSNDTYESVITPIIAAFTAQATQIGELQRRITSLENEVQVATGNVQTVTREKDDLIGGLRTQIADDEQRANQRQQEIEDRLSDSQSQTAERDLELRNARSELSAAQRDWDLEQARLEARILKLAEDTKFAKEPFSLYPDGKILEVSDKMPIGWVDIGANQRLTRGTRFRVESGIPGAKRFKAWAEVTRVEANRAEVSFTELADRYDPVVAGDEIINPLYDPTGGRNAVLCGRFSGSFNERELTMLLERLGIVVQPGLDLTTHFLIVGSELWADPDTGDPLDEPIQPSELPVYKEAEAIGVQIIPLQDIRAFFRVDSGLAGK